MAEEMTFKPGDLVALKSGSLPMAVAWVEEHLGTMSACCYWTERTKNGQDVKQQVFPLVVLVPAHEKKPVVPGVLKSNYPS